MEEKEKHIVVQGIEKEEQMMKKKEDKLKSIYNTLERNTNIQEKKKQDWLDRQIEMEEKKQQKELEELEEHMKKMQRIKKKEYYREAVKKKNMEILEEKKNKTLWRLEKIDMNNVSPQGRKRITMSQEKLETYGSKSSL